MVGQVITSDKAPKAIGPYSQAIKAGAWVYCSGQMAMDPETGQLRTGTIAEQTRQVLNNLKAVLEAAGCGLDKVVKTTVFLKNMDDFAEMNTEYGRFFPKNPPARSTVQVARLPKDAGIEIDAIAVGRVL